MRSSFHIIHSFLMKAIYVQWRDSDLELPGLSLQVTVSHGVLMFLISGKSSCLTFRPHSQNLSNKWDRLVRTSSKHMLSHMPHYRLRTLTKILKNSTRSPIQNTMKECVKSSVPGSTHPRALAPRSSSVCILVISHPALKTALSSTIGPSQTWYQNHPESQLSLPGKLEHE